MKNGRHVASSICSKAAGIIGPNKEKEMTHGPMEKSFGKCADLWSGYLGFDVSPADVAACMQLLKLSRIKTGDASHEGHYVDIAGYAGLQGALNGAK